ncbi:MAG: endonuclease/exonuclease/phosphatase family protein, partial [Pseudonocardiaceae bacterium]
MSTLHLLTWNIWGKNADWKSRETALLAAITDVRPDIIAIQEAWSEPGGVTQTLRIADAQGLGHRIQEDQPAPIRHHGLGLISRWPITTHQVLTLPAGGQPDEHRIALRTTIASPSGDLPLITTHLNRRLDHTAVRQAQVRHLAETTAEADNHDGWPTVLCGDFNAIPDSDEIRMLTGLTTPPVTGVVFQDAWTTAGDGSPGHTWSHDNPHAARERLGSARIDYLFVRWHPDRRGTIRHATTIPGRHGDTWASDHFGLSIT